MPLHTGDTIDGFLLGKELGRGATSVVYQATGAIDGVQGTFALKIYKPHIFETGSREREESIARETTTRERARHPNLCQIFGWRRVRIDGVRYRYLVTELVEGPSLERVILETGPLDVSTFVHIATQLTEATMALHAAGLLHRDIKTGNIIIEESTGRAVLADFGIIKDLLAATVQQTTGNDFKGTWHYAAPEAIERDGPAADAFTVDIYSLGATFFEMMTGRRLFTEVGTIARLADAIRNRAPTVTAPVYPVALVQLVRFMLAKTPGARPQLPDVLATLTKDHAAAKESAPTQRATDPLAKIRMRMEQDADAISRRAARESHAALVAFRSQLNGDVRGVLGMWLRISRLEQLPEVRAELDGPAFGNAEEARRAFPDREWSGAVRVGAIAPDLQPAYVAYLYDRIPEAFRAIRFFGSRGPNGIRIDLATAFELREVPVHSAGMEVMDDLIESAPAFGIYFARVNGA
jgi:serine/threonine protein kinase